MNISKKKQKGKEKEAEAFFDYMRRQGLCKELTAEREVLAILVDYCYTYRTICHIVAVQRIFCPFSSYFNKKLHRRQKMPRVVPLRLASKPTLSEKLLNLTRDSVQRAETISENAVNTGGLSGTEHFRVGSKELYFPKARVILLRPNAKHTPYQAKFIVPKSFNKLDLRDYLYHVYGLRAFNITTQLLHSRYMRVGAFVGRFRGPQIKKMTIEMEEPFIWPEAPAPGEVDRWNAEVQEELKKYGREAQANIGSDANKPITAFGGTMGPYGEGAQPFIPRSLREELVYKRDSTKDRIKYMEDVAKIDRHCREL